MKRLVEKEPDLTLEEIKRRPALDCTIGAIHRVLARPGPAYKKDAPCGRTSRGRGKAAKANLTRLRGHWRTTTMISSVRLDGTTACMAIEGATDTAVFQAYVREILLPVLRPGDIVILDNPGAHKNEHTLGLIRPAGAQVRFLPACSPDLNPIEMMWSKVKALLRKTQARSHPDLLQAISQALSCATPQDARGWLAACGYNFI